MCSVSRVGNRRELGVASFGPVAQPRVELLGHSSDEEVRLEGGEARGGEARGGGNDPPAPLVNTLPAWGHPPWGPLWKKTCVKSDFATS